MTNFNNFFNDYLFNILNITKINLTTQLIKKTGTLNISFDIKNG
jgi:hypothetical protein